MKSNTDFYQLLTETIGYSADHELHLTIGKTYVVYAVAVRYGYPWYYLADDNFTSYPIAYAAPFFQLVDNRLSEYWRFGHFMFDEFGEAPTSLIAFDEWSSDYSFYERLLDDEPTEKSVFRRYKELIEQECNTSF
jgi:hypothetical protein